MSSLLFSILMVYPQWSCYRVDIHFNVELYCPSHFVLEILWHIWKVAFLKCTNIISIFKRKSFKIYWLNHLLSPNLQCICCKASVVKTTPHWPCELKCKFALSKTQYAPLSFFYLFFVQDKWLTWKHIWNSTRRGKTRTKQTNQTTPKYKTRTEKYI